MGSKKQFLTFAEMRTERYRRLISLLFLAAFMSAICKNISCEISSAPFFASHNEVDDHGHTHASGVHHHHAHKHDHTQDSHEHEHDHDGSEAKDDQCCKALAKTLHAGLTKEGSVKPSFNKAYITTPFIRFQPDIEIVASNKAADHYSWKAPPPKIPDIRIFIHSFII